MLPHDLSVGFHLHSDNSAGLRSGIDVREAGNLAPCPAQGGDFHVNRPILSQPEVNGSGVVRAVTRTRFHDSRSQQIPGSGLVDPYLRAVPCVMAFSIENQHLQRTAASLVP